MRIREVFPYENPRKGQLELARLVYESIMESKILLVRYPVGIGKTAAILAGSLASEAPRIIYLAHTKSQFQAPLREIARLEERGIEVPVVTLTSKKDLCLLPRTLLREMDQKRFLRFCARKTLSGECPFKVSKCSCNLPNVLTTSILRKIGREMGVCPYEIAWEAVRSAKLIVASYVYLFDPRLSELLVKRGGVSFSESIVIVDEAHNLTRFISESLSSELQIGVIKAAIREVQRYGSQEESFVADALTRLSSLLKKKASDDGSEIPVELFLEIAPHSSTLSRVAAVIEGRMGGFPKIWQVADFVGEVENMPSDSVLLAVRQDVDAAFKTFFFNVPRIARRVFESVKAAVMLSATLPPKEYYVAVLGINEKRLKEASYPFTWGENVTLIIHKGISSRYAERTPELYRRYAKLIDEVFSDPETEHLMVVFPSYSFMLETYPFVFSKPRFLEKHDTQIEEVLEFLASHEKCLVMMTAWGKFSEGVEFRVLRRNLIDTIIIAGLPVPPPSPVNQKLVERLKSTAGNKEWAWKQIYLYPALMRVLQIIGRGVRTESDRVRVYLLDERAAEDESLRFLEDYGLSFSIIG